MIYCVILSAARKNIFTRCTLNFIYTISPISYPLASNKTLSQKQSESGAGFAHEAESMRRVEKKTLSLVTFPCINKTDLCDFI